jgi:mRNA interferase YafQ
MYDIVFTKKISRDLKRMISRGKSRERFNDVLTQLAAGAPLPPKYKDHALKGKWAGCRDCHIEDDWVLIYRKSETELMLIAMRTGTHADLEL